MSHFIRAIELAGKVYCGLLVLAGLVACGYLLGLLMLAVLR